MKITLAQLQHLFAANRSGCVKFVDAINAACEKYRINTPLRLAAFLAQIGHESGQLVYVRELWGPTREQVAYEGRSDLGNTEPGDGRRFLGRGLIQITGRANYQHISDDLGIDFVGNPQLLEQPEYAALSAGWFWDCGNLNHLADQQLFVAITRSINGGINGLADRKALYNAAIGLFTNQDEE